MSLEAKIEALTAAVTALTEAQTEHTERLNAVLAKGGAATDEGAEKPATRKPRAKKEETKAESDDDGEANTGTGTALTNDGVKKDVVAPWLGEFINDKDETEARKAKIKAALAKLVGKEGATVADVPAADLQRVVDWVAKQKDTDNGFGKGRLTAVAGAASDDDEDI